MNTELVLHRYGVRVVSLTQAPIVVHHELGYDKQRDPLATGGCVGQTGKHQMNDIICRVMVTPGDVDLLPENLVVITVALGAGFHGAQIRASSRLRQVHGA